MIGKGKMNKQTKIILLGIIFFIGFSLMCSCAMKKTSINESFSKQFRADTGPGDIHLNGEIVRAEQLLSSVNANIIQLNAVLRENVTNIKRYKDDVIKYTSENNPRWRGKIKNLKREIIPLEKKGDELRTKKMHKKKEAEILRYKIKGLREEANKYRQPTPGRNHKQKVEEYHKQKV
jgi:hypothetical protein